MNLTDKQKDLKKRYEQELERFRNTQLGRKEVEDELNEIEHIYKQELLLTHNATEISNVDARRRIVEQEHSNADHHNNMNKEYGKYERIKKNFADGYEKDYGNENKNEQKELNVDEMSPLQLMSEGHRLLAEQQKEEE